MKKVFLLSFVIGIISKALFEILMPYWYSYYSTDFPNDNEWYETCEMNSRKKEFLYSPNDSTYKSLKSGYLFVDKDRRVEMCAYSMLMDKKNRNYDNSAALDVYNALNYKTDLISPDSCIINIAKRFVE